MYYVVSNELYHHGILGQKWGVRRFQNQDGSYTAAGKERYGIEDGKRRSLKSYALEYKDRRENKNRYTRMKKNQNLDTMSFDEMKRLQEREALKGQIQWQQKQNDPNAWKKQLGRELVSTAAKGLVEGASKELGRQIINAPVRLAGYAGDKTISAAGWSARQLVDVATNQKKQDALKRAGKAVGGEITSFTQNAAGAGQGFVREMGSQAKSFGSGARDAARSARVEAVNAKLYAKETGRKFANEARNQANSFTSGAADATRSASRNASDFARGFSSGFKGTVYYGGRRAASSMNKAASNVYESARRAGSNVYESARRANAQGQSEMYRRKYGTYALPGQKSKVKYYGKGIYGW